jgi:hypothetical protein
VTGPSKPAPPIDPGPGLTLRAYQPGDEQAILETFNLVFREVCGESYVDRTMDFWRWEFLENPWGHRISLAIAKDGTVASQYAGVVYPMATAFGDCTFIHIVDSMAHPDYRKGLKRPGVFVVTGLPWFQMCYDAGDAVMYGYPVPIAERIGQRYLEYNRLRVVDFLCRPAALGSVESPAAVVVEKVDAFDSEVDQLFQTVAAEKQCLTRRNQEFLTWRWVKIPTGDYELYVARRGGKLSGLMVLRPVHELVPGCCCIADWLVPEADTETMDALLARATARGREAGRETLMTIFPEPSPEYRALVERGFVAVPSAHTLERRLTHRIYHPQMTTEWLEQHWWYTLGDSDLV